MVCVKHRKFITALMGGFLFLSITKRKKKK
nr:MAG TPA: hypothetical protein [Caudoviricetes sp.]